MSRFVHIENTATGYSAYSPDLPGWVATGSTRGEIEQQMHEAIKFTSKDSACRVTRFLNRVRTRLL